MLFTNDNKCLSQGIRLTYILDQVQVSLIKQININHISKLLKNAWSGFKNWSFLWKHYGWSRWILVVGRNIYRTCFKHRFPERNELFLPGRMAYVVDLEDEYAENDVPCTTIRSKADCPSLEVTPVEISCSLQRLGILTSVMLYWPSLEVTPVEISCSLQGLGILSCVMLYCPSLEVTPVEISYSLQGLGILSSVMLYWPSLEVTPVEISWSL